MPPKPKFTRKMILDAALEIVRSEGWSELSARKIAKQLNSSVGPIYSFLKSMGALEEELIQMVYELLYEYMTVLRTEDRILNLGVGYVAFARDEKHLFKCFANEKYSTLRQPYSDRLWQSFLERFSTHQRYEGLAPEQIERHRKKMIVFIYGLAVLINTGALAKDMDDEKIADLLRETGDMLLSGLRTSLEE